MIFDVQGKLLWNVSAGELTSAQRFLLPRGVYPVRIATADGRTYASKLRIVRGAEGLTAAHLTKLLNADDADF